jgi:hypothetical protein
LSRVTEVFGVIAGAIISVVPVPHRPHPGQLA